MFVAAVSLAVAVQRFAPAGKLAVNATTDEFAVMFAPPPIIFPVEQLALIDFGDFESDALARETIATLETLPWGP